MHRLKKRQGRSLVLALILALALAGCSAIPGMSEKKSQFEMGEKVSTYWFDFTVNGVEVLDSYEGYQPEEGFRLVVCSTTIKNTFGETVSMYWSDFVLLWEDEGGAGGTSASSLSGMDGSYPIPSDYAQEQLPDEYNLEKGETREGVLVFEAPDWVTEAAVVFQELYAEGESESKYSEGDHYMVWLSLM